MICFVQTGGSSDGAEEVKRAVEFGPGFLRAALVEKRGGSLGWQTPSSASAESRGAGARAARSGDRGEVLGLADGDAHVVHARIRPPVIGRA